MHEQGRTIGADDLLIVPHIEIDMRVIVRRGRAHALELLDADHDPIDALVVHEMRHQSLRHDTVSIVARAAASIVSLEAER